MAENSGYQIVNMVRARSSRTQRVMSPTNYDASLWILGRRVLPKRPILIHDALFKANEEMLLSMVRSGKISIITPDKTVIDSLPDGKLFYTRPGEAVRLEDAVVVKATPVQAPVPPPPVVEETVSTPEKLDEPLPVVEEKVAEDVAEPKPVTPSTESLHEQRRRRGR